MVVVVDKLSDTNLILDRATLTHLQALLYHLSTHNFYPVDNYVDNFFAIDTKVVEGSPCISLVCQKVLYSPSRIGSVFYDFLALSGAQPAIA